MEITKISHGPPSTIVCKLMNLTEAFLTENHLEVRTRGRKEGHEIGNLELPLGDIWEIEASWWVGGGGGGVGDFQCRPINPVILFYLMDCSMRFHVSSCTNRAGLKQPVTTMWIKPQASQAHVSRKRKQFIHEVVKRCVTRYMGNRNNSDGKTSLKR